MPDSNILAFLFSTMAAIVATLTGLIGGFATFRLQRLDAKLDFLKDYVLHKELDKEKTFNSKLREFEYGHIEKIYRHDAAAVQLLDALINELDYHQHTQEYLYDIKNINRHQMLYDEIKTAAKRSFVASSIFVFICLTLLIFTNKLLNLVWLWQLLAAFLLAASVIFHLLIRQVKRLIN